ncbi:GGDEF domain-containing protein [Vibrio mediterranei]|uniref:diguanylate cyclase n=1 Tax=Vibrio mediterranei TaxID=689 RepID=A0A3G4VP23_9VIBR|nr:diguanylate cyclase [Vibrio mediterranei]AYV24611.1 diguanylate cyclase [Vibrio mediterranei]NUW75022.1 diguanylate cyclase [Vibrio mediterranei]
MTPMDSSMRILLVDDAQLERMQLQIRLKQLGHVVEVAASGREALALYPSFDPELVLLDISMPEMDGFQVAAEIRERYQADWIPIIFLSSHDEPEMIAKAIRAGGDDYLVKPVNKIVLQSKLVAMQRIAHMRRELKQASAQLQEANRALQHQANEDGLTKLFNRRYMDEKLTELIQWHGRHQMPLSVILMDVDHFKAFNDNYGHTEGDQCLINIAQFLDVMFIRSGEYVGRYGGEEFVILLSKCDIREAEENAARVREGISQLNIPHQFSHTTDRVTLSLGVFSLVPTGTETINELYESADKLLYQAKRTGRNRYVSQIEGDIISTTS